MHRSPKRAPAGTNAAVSFKPRRFAGLRDIDDLASAGFGTERSSKPIGGHDHDRLHLVLA